MSESFVVSTIDGAALAGERRPAPGPTVVLLHAGVADRRVWQEVADGLHARGADVIAYDRRGFGETPGTSAPFRHVDDLLAVLDATTSAPAWLVGNSQGGLIALDVALAAPTRVAGLVLIAPAVSGASEPDEEELDPATRALATAIDRAEEAGDLDALNRLELRLWLDGPDGREGRVGDPARALALAMNAIALGADQPPGGGAGDGDAWSRLEEVGVPATVAWGALDLRSVKERCRVLAARLPELRDAVELPGVAHLPSLERPELVTDLLAAAVGLRR